MAKQTKKISAYTDVTTISSTQRIPLTDSNGGVTKISLANLKAAMLAGMSLDAMQDNVFIYTVDSSGTLRLVRPAKWDQYKNSGYTPIGVGLMVGSKNLVIALDETTATWSSAAVSAGGYTTSNRKSAMNDWAGETSKTAQMTHAECNTAAYAPGYCALYSKLNSDSKGLGAGAWWLPSLAELMLIYANVAKINYALSLIDGATQLDTSTWYWSSTEYSQAYAWGLNFGTGGITYTTKATSSLRVRPVSAFQ